MGSAGRGCSQRPFDQNTWCSGAICISRRARRILRWRGPPVWNLRALSAGNAGDVQRCQTRFEQDRDGTAIPSACHHRSWSHRLERNLSCRECSGGTSNAVIVRRFKGKFGWALEFGAVGGIIGRCRDIACRLALHLFVCSFGLSLSFMFWSRFSCITSAGSIAYTLLGP